MCVVKCRKMYNRNRGINFRSLIRQFLRLVLLFDLYLKSFFFDLWKINEDDFFEVEENKLLISGGIENKQGGFVRVKENKLNIKDVVLGIKIYYF